MEFLQAESENIGEKCGGSDRFVIDDQVSPPKYYLR